MLRTLSLLFFILIPFLISAQTEIELKDKDDIYLIGKSVSYLKIPPDSLSFEEILSKNPKFTLSQEEQLSFGFTTDIVWIKFTIDNQTNFDNWILDIDMESLGHLAFYYQEEDEWKKSETGTLSPFATRQTGDTGFSFFLKVPANSKRTFYLSAKTDIVSLIIPLRIQSYKHFNKYVKLKNIYYGGYFGVLLVMILYNLFLYFSIRDTNYLYYVFTIITTLGLFSTMTGYNFMLFWTDAPENNILIGNFFSGSLIISTAVFTIHFLQLRKYSYLLYYWMLVHISLAILYFLIPDTLLLQLFLNILFTLHAITMVVTGVFTWYKGHFFAKYYFFAWLLYIFGGITLTLTNMAIFPSNLFTLHAVEVGSVLEVIIISFALGAKYRVLKREKEAAIQDALTIQEKANEELENKVQERTNELQTTLEMVGKQNIEIEKKNTNINASINYASRIQSAFLAISDEIKQVLPEYFIFFKPRDVVSGDFYFFTKKEGKIIIVAADSTGHGIPGAMMSMIGEAYLSQIISAMESVEADEILSQMHDRIQVALLQNQNIETIQDGMDMAICVIDKKNKILDFAGAKRPLIYIKNNEIYQIKGDRFPIGGSNEGSSIRVFKKHSVSIESELSIYLFSDGYQDQFGGQKNRKFMTKSFKNLLLEIHQKPLEAQKKILETTFHAWKGDESQTDDVLVIGFKVS